MSKMKMAHNNKGFSLVELIVTVLITSVLMIGVIAFISTSRSAYQSVAVSSTLQEETMTIKRILTEYIQEAQIYGFEDGIDDITGSTGDVRVLWVVARDTEINSNPDCSYFFVLDEGDKKLRYCTGEASLCPKNQTTLTDGAKTLIAEQCFSSNTKKQYSVIGEHVESMEKSGTAQRGDGTDLIAIKMVYRYPDGAGKAYNDEITVVTRNRLRATPTPTPKPTADPGTTDPGTTLPGTTDPGTILPDTTDPDTTDPDTTDPDTTDPDTTDPDTTAPDTTDPDTTDPDTTDPDTTDPDTTEPEATVTGLLTVESSYCSSRIAYGGTIHKVVIKTNADSITPQGNNHYEKKDLTDGCWQITLKNESWCTGTNDLEVQLYTNSAKLITMSIVSIE